MPPLIRLWQVPVSLMLATLTLTAGCLGCGEQQPEVRLATLNELKALVPKELLVVPPEDKAAKARYVKLVALAKKIDSGDASKVTSNWSALWAIAKGNKTSEKVTQAAQLALVKKIWKANPHLLSDLESVLTSGPLALPSTEAWEEMDNSRPIIDLTRMLAFSASSDAAFGDSESATRRIVLLNRLCDALLFASRSIMSFLGNSLVMGISTSTTDLYAQAKFPAQDCLAILKFLRPSPKEDTHLVAAIKAEFLQYTLPDLATNKPKLTGGGSYDAIETVKRAAQRTQIAILNARVPFSKVDRTYYKQLEQDANDVLKEIYQGSYKGPYKSTELAVLVSNTLEEVNPGKPPTPNTDDIRSALNEIHNSVGRLILFQNYYWSFPSISCNWRVTRDLARIRLASRVYRANHGGQLPPTFSGFIPILGAWPTNPFDGKPFTYLPKQEKVYGVGDDLTDHGGNFGNGIVSGKDAGMSLKLAK